MINLYNANGTDFTRNGLVVLSDALSCIITEELNGAYELELEYPLDERGKWQYLLENNIIKADGQLFRIYRKIKTLTTIKVNARHIFYDLIDNFLEDVRPTNLSGYGALDWVLTHTQYTHPFTSMGDVGGSDTKYYIRKNVVEAIMGSEGIINTWGGEIVRDNFVITLLGTRGLDRGVLVAYGKNIQGIEETLDMDGLVTRIMPLGKDALMLPEKYVDSQYINNFPHPKIRVIEFNDIEDEATLRAAGQNYFIESKCDIPQFNYKIDFLELSKTEEYKNYAVLERVYMADTTTIKHSKLLINLKAKVIKITKNILTNRIEKVELGSFKPNIASAINNSIQSVKKEILNSTSFLQAAIENATNLLTTALGGYVVKRAGELLIMDTEDPMTAMKVWRWNINGLGYSSTGINGPFGLAMTMDGSIVASYVNTGVLNATIIKAGILKSFNNLSWINMDNGTFDLAGKVTFDGTTFAINAEAVKIAVGKIGGNNLIKNGGFELGFSGWNLNVGNENVNIGTADTTWDGNRLLIVAPIGATSGYQYGVYQYSKVKVGVKYSWQARIYSDCPDGVQCLIGGVVSQNAQGGDWRFMSGTFTATSADCLVMFLVKGTISGGGTSAFYLDNVELEEGDNATAWSPHASEFKSGCFEVTDEHARFSANDGSYTEFVPSSTGLKWHKGATSKDYHYLSHIGYVYNATNFYLTGVVYQLPDEFKGKDCYILAIPQAMSGGSSDELFSLLQVDSQVENKENGTIRVFGELDTTNRTTGAYTERGLRVGFIVIA